MRRVLAAAVLVAFMPTANAQDKGKADISTNAEFRARYYYLQNPSLDEKQLSSFGMSEARFKLGMHYKANEKISAHFTGLYNTDFGLNNNTDSAGKHVGTQTVPGTTTTDVDENIMSVNEVYGTWMSSDDLNFKVGRMNYQVSDGSVIGTNDWEKVPYAFEGLLGTWEQEWGKLQLAMFKIRNPTGTSASGDPGHNMYGLNFDLKTMPEWLKGVNAHIFKDTSDAIEQGAPGLTGQKVMNTTNGLDTMRYGFNAGFGFGAFDFKAWYEKMSGDVKHIAVGGTKQAYDYEGDMMQVEAGFSLPNFMGSRFSLMYHKDSGDDDVTTTAAAGNTKWGTYDSYYAEQHGTAGFMDLIAWGNLTDIAVTWSLKPQDKTDVGLSYHMFKRTEASATSASFTPGNAGGNLPTGLNDKADLGDEINLWAVHHYDAGFSTTAFVGYFMPGDYFKDAATNNKSDKAMWVVIEGKATF